MSKTKKTAKQVTPVAQTPVSIPVQELKGRFKARSIPLETDFADIIDVADCGRKAVGLSPDFPQPATDTGLTLDNTTGQLKVLPEPNKGITVSSSGLAVTHNSTLEIQNNQLGVADSAFNHVVITKSITTTSPLELTLLYTTTQPFCASIKVICNGGQQFKLDVLGQNYWGGTPGGMSASISNVRYYSGCPISTIYIGASTSNTGTVSLVFTASTTVTLLYSLSDIHSMDVIGLDENLPGFDHKMGATPDAPKEFFKG